MKCMYKKKRTTSLLMSEQRSIKGSFKTYLHRIRRALMLEFILSLDSSDLSCR